MDSSLKENLGVESQVSLVVCRFQNGLFVWFCKQIWFANVGETELLVLKQRELLEMGSLAG